MGWLWKIGLSGLKWIGINIGLPIIIDLVGKYMNKPKFVESAKPDDDDAKAIEKAKQDGWK